jgi:hypothetical protein
MPDPEWNFVICDLHGRRVNIKTSDQMRTLGDMRSALDFHFGVPPHHVHLICCGRSFGNDCPDSKQLTDLFYMTEEIEGEYERLIHLLWLNDEDFIVRTPIDFGQFELIRAKDMDDVVVESADKPYSLSYMTIGQFKRFEPYSIRKYATLKNTNQGTKAAESASLINVTGVHNDNDGIDSNAGKPGYDSFGVPHSSVYPPGMFDMCDSDTSDASCDNDYDKAV